MRKALCVVLRVVLGGLFVYAGLVKASDSQQFALALVPFTFLPPGSEGFLAVGLAWTELTAGVLILLPRIYPVGAIVIGGLCLLFIGVLCWALWNGIVVSCSCFGDGGTPSVQAMVTAVVRDVFLLAAAVAVVWFRGGGAGASPLARPVPGDTFEP